MFQNHLVTIVQECAVPKYAGMRTYFVKKATVSNVEFKVTIKSLRLLLFNQVQFKMLHLLTLYKIYDFFLNMSLKDIFNNIQYKENSSMKTNNQSYELHITVQSKMD